MRHSEPYPLPGEVQKVEGSFGGPEFPAPSVIKWAWLVSSLEENLRRNTAEERSLTPTASAEGNEKRRVTDAEHVRS